MKNIGKRGSEDLSPNMKPDVECFQESTGTFSQEGFSKTLDYVNRQDAHQMKQSSGIKKQAYKGRYS